MRGPGAKIIASLTYVFIIFTSVFLNTEFFFTIRVIRSIVHFSVEAQKVV